MAGQQPVFVVNQAPERQQGRKAQISNITAAKTVADVIRSCLGPKAMLKMLLDPMGGILLTNDGHAILREIEVAHPAAKSMIELSRTQDEEVGDGTTSVIILAGEILAQSLASLEAGIHPVVIIAAYKRALSEALSIIDRISVPVNVNDDDEMLALIKTSINTKFVSRWSELMCRLALKAVRTVAVMDASATGNLVSSTSSASLNLSSRPSSPSGPASTGGAGAQSASASGASSSLHTVDIKRYARVEKVPGGEIEASRVLDGVMLAKDVTHPKMRRRIENPRIILLDCPLEYKKGESQTNIEITKEEDWNRILEIEEEQIKTMCDRLIEFKPDLIFTEKGVSDLAQHYLLKADITAIRRVRKSDNNRIARATGATIVNRVEDLRESDIGEKCGLFHIEKLGDEYFTFLEKCKDPKACTILLRGPSKDIINEIERNLADAMSVARNVVFHPFLAPGGGATEMAIAVGLSEFARSAAVSAGADGQAAGKGSSGGVQAGPIRAVADAMEVIPRTLIQNCGGNAIRTLTTLRAKHANGEYSWGVDGDTGKVVDMKDNGLYESAAVKVQTLKTAIESASLLLRVDDVVSARRARQQGGGGGGPQVHNMAGAEDGAPEGDMPGMG
ncbi:T-complex protein 1 subunit gamma [Tilletia horrida]|uniref:T-complex protein 1 subunit gamma n=1 Tax=Tilletia horrida TaxID=155126 RepID=A0AAN6GD81_9BASI|nr:T-complex protein 1 subunit gamma [Tilletia horrida]KAK0541530.1 T-complex protein 1 subunit gamma [Tilletia horrida]